MTPPNGFRLHELSSAPEEPGVYAWYYQIELSKKDIQDCIERVVQSNSESERRDIVKTFLERRLFMYYRETPYEVSLRGPMKPTYAGSVYNQVMISEALVERITEDPERLNGLRDLLRDSVPLFSSPIYIGVAKNLRNRLLQHKALIEKFQNAQALEDFSPPAEAADEQSREAERDHSFAREVSTIRNFATQYLVAYTMAFPVDEHLRVDLENILNRINYPLCGRN
jgi:hypothetical protein